MLVSNMIAVAPFAPDEAAFLVPSSEASLHFALVVACTSIRGSSIRARHQSVTSMANNEQPNRDHPVTAPGSRAHLISGVV